MLCYDMDTKENIDLTVGEEERTLTHQLRTLCGRVTKQVVKLLEAEQARAEGMPYEAGKAKGHAAHGKDRVKGHAWSAILHHLNTQMWVA